MSKVLCGFRRADGWRQGRIMACAVGGVALIIVALVGAWAIFERQEL